MATRKKLRPRPADKVLQKISADGTVYGTAHAITQTVKLLEFRLQRLRGRLVNADAQDPEKDLSPTPGSPIMAYLEYSNTRLDRIVNILAGIEHIVGIEEGPVTEQEEEDYFDKLAKQS